MYILRYRLCCIFLPTTELGKIKKGDEATVIPEPKEIGAFAAKVKVVDQVIDAASGTFGVRLEVGNPDYKIPAGIRCQIEFKLTHP